MTKKKTVLITGASGRLGLFVAKAFGKDYNLILHYNSNRDIIAKELCDIDYRLFQADFLSDTAINTFNDIISENDIDILINNASTFNKSRLETVSFDSFCTDIKMNAWFPFEITRMFCEVSQKGVVINILDSKINGYDFEHFGYHVSKTILELFTREQALKYSPNHRINAVAPGLMDMGCDNFDASRLPLRKAGCCQDVTEAVLYLSNADFVTGQTIFIDGGRHLRKE